MSEADLEAGVVNDEFNLLATESSDVCTGGTGGRRDSNEGDGWGDEDGWDEDFEDQTSYPTLTALDKNGIKVPRSLFLALALRSSPSLTPTHNLCETKPRTTSHVFNLRICGFQ